VREISSCHGGATEVELYVAPPKRGRPVSRKPGQDMAMLENNRRIFVQIPAYRDSELASTLLDLYRKAASPDRLRVSVHWQRAGAETLPAKVLRLPRLELIETPFERSRGCNWARSVVQKRWRDEPFTLFLDSHHRFVSGWDDLLFDMYDALRDRGVERPLLTAYMPSYSAECDPLGRQTEPYKIYPSGREAGLLIHLISHRIVRWTELNSPVPGTFISGHFIFARGQINADMPCDPRIYFTGDEVSMSLRAYTLGYDVFHPHRVIGWHCYDRSTRVTHWTDHHEWRQLHEQSMSRLRRLFAGRLRGRFALGRQRSRRSFEDSIYLPLIEDC